MLIYILLPILIYFLSRLKKNMGIYLSLYVIILVIGGLRDISVGTDTINYYGLFTMEYSNPTIEPAWTYLNKACAFLFGKYSYVVFIGTFLAITPVFIRAWKSYHNPLRIILFYVLLYYLYSSFNITRQAIAVSLIFFSIEYLLQEKWWKYLFFVMLATTFHYSALVCLLFPLVLKIKFTSNVSVIFFLLITYILGVSIGGVVIKILSHIPIIGGYSTYLVGEADVSITRLFLNLFFIAFTYVSSKRDIYYTLVLLGISIFNLFCFSSAVTRMALYFMIFQIVLYSETYSIKKDNAVISNVLIYFYAIFYYAVMLMNNIGGVVPYKMSLFVN